VHRFFLIQKKCHFCPERRRRKKMFAKK